MQTLSDRPAGNTRDDDIERVVTTYGTPVFRLCLMMLGRQMDAEDAVSETLIRYMNKAPAFQSPAQEKAWLCTVAANICRDMLRKRRRLVSLEETELSGYARTMEDKAILDALKSLPEKYRAVLCLHYVEGYKTDEIAQILRIRPGTVRKRLQYARRLLKLEYEQE